MTWTSSSPLPPRKSKASSHDDPPPGQAAVRLGIARRQPPSLQTIKDLLAALPDGKLLESLRRARGKGRNDYAVHVLWGVVVLRVVLRHVTTEAVLAELRRNEGLRRLIGIESEAGVPKPWNLSRFEEVLGQEPHRSLLK